MPTADEQLLMSAASDQYDRYVALSRSGDLGRVGTGRDRVLGVDRPEFFAPAQAPLTFSLNDQR